MSFGWNQDDDDEDYDVGGGLFSNLFRNNDIRSIRIPYMFGETEPPERDPDEDPFARIESRAEDDLKERADSRRYAERREQAQAEAAFAAWLADVRELPEVVS